MSSVPPPAGGVRRSAVQRPAPPTQEYLSPDPYPEDSEEPPITADDVEEVDQQQHEYDEADIDAEEAAQQQQQQAVEPNVFEDDEHVSYLPAPVQHPQQRQPQYRPAIPTIPPAQQARLAGASAAAGRPAQPAQPQQRNPTNTTKQQQQQPARPPAEPAMLSVDMPDDPNPFDTQPSPPAPAQLHQRRPSLPSAAVSGSLRPPTTITPRSGGAAAPGRNASASPALSASPSEPSHSADPPTTSSSSSTSLPKSGSLQNFNNLLGRVSDSIERHGEDLVKLARGIEQENEKKAKVDDVMLTSLDYDSYADMVHAKDLDESSKHSAHVLSGLTLLLTIAIALVTATAMFCVSRLVEYCFDRRVDLTLELIMDGDPYGAYFALLGASVFLAAIATILVTYFAPHAKGGGVPYVQAYLNGTNVASYFSPRIVLVKIVALGFTISAGMPLGMEGPFVFIGSGIGMLMCKGLDLLSFHQRLGGKYARILKNINEERVFMAGGMAAGLAVAFNAPIAGVLMALEGSTAFLTVPVVLRIFGCAMFATFFNDLGKADFSAQIRTHNLILITEESNPRDYVWVIGEIVCFTVIAILGGLLGALAIWINVKMTKWRHHSVEPHPPKNQLNTVVAVGEVLAIVFVTMTAWFVLPYVFGCRMQHEQCFPTIAVPKRCMQVQCPDKYYSEIGTIIYSPSDTVARILFDRTLEPMNDLTPFPLFIYASFYLVICSIAYGSHVPGGLFVPSIVVGGCMGRIVGWVIHAYITTTVNPGVYALLGAASMFGGFTRLALPAVIMLVEMTGDSTYLLPIMFCTVLAKLVSDEIIPPLYPQHMVIEGIPTLGDKLNPLIAPLSATHIMSRTFYAVEEIDTLEHIMDVLDKSRSMVLPVTNGGKFVGMIMRRSVIYALKYAPKFKTTADLIASLQAEASAHASIHSSAQASPSSTSVHTAVTNAVEKKMGGWDDTTDYAKSIEKFDEKYAKAVIGLTQFMDAGALTAHEETSAKRIAAIFRRLGISHLAVSDHSNKLVGIITRRHLIKPPTLPVAAAVLAQQRSTRNVQGIDPTDSAEPEESVVDIVQAGDTLESEAMNSIALAQRRSQITRRAGSILMGTEPAVRFDDEEDEEFTSPSESDLSPSPDPTDEDGQYLYDLSYEANQAAFQDATGVAFDHAVQQARDGAGGRMRIDSDVTRGSPSSGSAGGQSGVGTPMTPAARIRKTPRSSLSRLNAYTKDIQ